MNYDVSVGEMCIFVFNILPVMDGSADRTVFRQGHVFPGKIRKSLPYQFVDFSSAPDHFDFQLFNPAQSCLPLNLSTH